MTVPCKLSPVSSGLVVGWALLIFASGSVAADSPSPAALEQFEKKVRPIFVEHCASCHGADPKKIKAGFQILNRQNLLTGGDSGPAIVPGQPDKSLLVEVIRYQGDLKMPPRGKLKDSEIAAIRQWIQAGAPWPEAAADAKDAAPKKPGVLFSEEQKKFWAFQPVRKPAQLPPVPDSRRVQNPIDAFILSKLEAAGLKPAAAADKKTLIRRVTFDLTGLPPTPSEIEQFEKDSSAQAFEKVVDRLLASPAYGERWARHWLDVARYADSNGLDENTAFGNAWKYRDYVIRSFNADKPFSQFLQEQIAGDLLPISADQKVQADRYTALGYLVLGPKLLAEPDKQKMLIDIADEQIDTLGKGLLGLTLGCARCHDHKFDPIPTRDYYSLLSIFTSTRTMQNLNTVARAFERPLSPPEDPKIVRAREAFKKKNSERKDFEQKLSQLDAKETEKKKDYTQKIEKLRQEAADLEKIVPDLHLEKVRKELRDLETQFGKVPETNKAKRLEIHQEAEKRRAAIKELEPQVYDPNFVLSVEEGSPGAYGTQPRNLFVQIRGNYTTPGEEAPPIFPRILVGESAPVFVSTKPNGMAAPEPLKTRFGAPRPSSGRLELARWLTDPQHPLTARVFVNRIWQHHFGEGLVRSVDNFGRLGERPSHPELLDWLAAEFLEHNGSVKHLHKVILLSATYQQGSRPDEASARLDPDNRLLGHFPRQRLEAEPLRDAMLAVAGTLDRQPATSLLPSKNFDYVTNDQSGSAAHYNSNKRSIYLPVVRNNVFPFFQTFDFPDPSMMVGHRDRTVIAPQALYLMNNPFVRKQAEAFARRIWESDAKEVAARVELAYLMAFGRPARPEEIAQAREFLQAFEKTLANQKDPAQKTLESWSVLAQSLFASNEFVFID
ncbi:DUF1553 domain-containing protein [Telmatocola sphagniphila]|uniref:DUF1553 domain-containing protein n=1 Tax=Telmatocola sphagniphila TaxID=1123043 RepID=A0A8E6BB73_9BACT|nr:PSD1 and planctomycete cytochrome C domain-containing protein [Telmatocola sphagniphila]QVL33740.1 DUF1553 domain-containing protein [Telmatocola sphagniphila]